MADEVDRAQAREEHDRALALAAHQARAAAAAQASPDGLCIQCGEDIEPARLDALRGATSRCIECATAHELRMRGQR